MNTIAVYSSKGGVGKTAAAVNLSYGCALRGKRTLLCDMDPQGASSFYYRISIKGKLHKKQFLKGKLRKYIWETGYPHLDLLPAHFSFRNLDIALDSTDSDALKNIFATLRDDYDVLIMDCPPNMTLLSENLLMAADQVVVPVVPTILSIRTLAQLMKFCDKIGVNQKKIHAFFSMVERRKSLHVDTVKSYGKKKIFLKTLVPYLADVEKMGVNREPVAVTSPGSPAAVAYDRLWMEIWKHRTRD